MPSIGAAGDVRGSHRVFVIEAVRSVLATTASVPIEVIVVAGRSMSDDIAVQLAELGDGTIVRCVAYDDDFNFSATVNLGAAHAVGRHLLLLNDDTEAIAGGWLEAMLDAGAQPEVGARRCSIAVRGWIVADMPVTPTAPRSTTSASVCPATRLDVAGCCTGVERWLVSPQRAC